MSGPIVPDIVLEAHGDREISRGRQRGGLVTALDHVLAQHNRTKALAEDLVAMTGPDRPRADVCIPQPATTMGPPCCTSGNGPKGDGSCNDQTRWA